MHNKRMASGSFTHFDPNSSAIVDGKAPKTPPYIDTVINVPPRKNESGSRPPSPLTAIAVSVGIVEEALAQYAHKR